MQAIPDVRSDRRVVQAQFFDQLALESFVRSLTGIDPAARQRPARSGGELEAHQQHAVAWSAHDGANGVANTQPVD